ncbi:unnamed protein product [Psylliodes chrysocephalus]|uniref:Uncharacterized protein n=1 Tax=Psylliodes chrysocephalus TaxID=3402493 RepID=A0A9P0CGK9_9CUCU|nr:unnamed protein product [Psylliodes chrysocephala]
MFPVGRGHKLCELARQSVLSTGEHSSPKSTMSKATDNFNNTEIVTLRTVAGESVTSQNVPIILPPNTVGQYILQNITNKVEVENFSDQNSIIAGLQTSNTELNSDQILDENSSTGGSEYKPIHDSHTDESEYFSESHESDPVTDLAPNNHNINEGQKRRKLADPTQWKRNRNKKLRMERKPYIRFVDSVHACVERKLKNREIKLPCDYITITREARKNPAPYEAVNCEYSLFKNYSTPLRYSSIRPGRVSKDSVVVMDIRVIDYDPMGVIRVDHSNLELSDLPIRSKKFPPTENYPNLFTQRCTNPKSKWQHI